MAVGIATSPALVQRWTSGTLTTAAFSPAAGTLLVACVAAFNAAPTVSGGGLTWTRRVQRIYSGAYHEIWTAPCAAGASGITVSVTGSWSGAALKVYVVTGASLATPVGATGNNSTAVNNSNVAAYTSTGAGSRGFLVAVEYTTGSPTSTDDFTAFGDSSHFWGLVAAKAANTPTAGTSVTFNLDAAGSGTADWQWAAIEVLTGSVDASVTPASVTATASVPAPTVSYGAGAHPDPVTTAAGVPAPSVSAGAGAHPDPVTVTAAVPTPNVSTQPTELVYTDPVTAAADVPAPAASAGAGAPLLTVETSAVVPAPSARVDADVILGPVAIAVSIPHPVVTVPVLPGDQITGDFQIEFGGLLFGGYGNRYQVLAGSVEGWDDLPSLDSGNVLRPSRHGSWAGRRLSQDRQVSATIGIDASGDFTSALSALRQVLVPPDDETEVPLVVSGRDEVLLAWAAVDARVIPTQDYATGWAPVQVRWTCSDPRRYGLIRLGVTVPVGVETSLFNGGNVATHPLIRIPGPAVNPILTNALMGRSIQFTITLGSDERLDIDTDAGTVAVGDTNKMSALSGSSVPVQDFVLGVGANPITYTTTSGGAGGADFLWRDAHL
ncbi:phage distal tail protein [Streptosporangium jomthongense]|uniref:Siphovirus-type tail component C-terminal domain-containing protein n=1 Tax=Streptosporangium jomthongense TaxID=1193683 RepID=A0ABV8FCK9_9ACTN